jgi:hypothetical protein
MTRPAAALAALASILALTACASTSSSSSSLPSPSFTPIIPAVTGSASILPSSPASPPATTTAVNPPGMLAIHDPGIVTGSLAGRTCHYAPPAATPLPDPACTPGSIDPAVTQATIATTICRKGGYTSTVRPPASQTTAFKYRQAYPAYDVPASTPTELDHLVSLELGGSNDATNLWPEPPPSPNPKDRVEDTLHAAVCAHRVTLAAAQSAIASDWLTALARLGLAS